MPNIEKVTEIYNGVSVECAHLTIDKAGQTYRFSKVFDTTSEYNMVDDYAWQMIAKANSNKSITLTVGDKNTTFSLTTAFARYTNIFYSVNPSSYPYVEIVFPTTGEYWFYHVQLEHGNTITDWHSETEDAVIIATENMTEAVKKWTTFYDTKFEKTDESIKLNARAITANADNIAEVRSDMEASFIVQADQISSIVTDIETLDDKVENYNSSITQTAKNISTQVSSKVGNNEIISKINQSAEQITINAGKVNLQGYVTFTNLGGNDNTTVIDGKHLTTGTISSTNGNTSWNLDDGTLTMRKGSISIKDGNNTEMFSVSNTGQLKARSGYIGNGSNGFTIGDNNIRNGLTSLSDTTNEGVYVGVDGIALGKGAFKVTKTGALTASNVTITGGSVSITGNLSAGNGKFYVDGNTGNVYCNKIYGVLDNGTRTSDIYFQMGKDAIYNSGGTDIMISNKLVAKELYIKNGKVQIAGSGSGMDNAPNYINLSYNYAISSTSHTTSSYMSASYFQATENYTSTSIDYYYFAKMSNRELNIGTQWTNNVMQEVTTDYSQHFGIDGISIVDQYKRGIFYAKTSLHSSADTKVVFGTGNGSGDVRFLDEVYLTSGKVYFGSPSSNTSLSNYITSRFTFVEPQTVTYTLYEAGSDTTRYTLPTGTTIQYVMYMRFGYLVYVYFSINVSTAPSANISFDMVLPATVPTARIKKSGSTADPGQYDAALGAMSSSGSAGRMWILGDTRKISIRLPKIVTYYTGVLIYPTSSI